MVSINIIPALARDMDIFKTEKTINNGNNEGDNEIMNKYRIIIECTSETYSSEDAIALYVRRQIPMLITKTIEVKKINGN